MLIRLFSDIHLDFDVSRIPKRDPSPRMNHIWKPASSPLDGETTLVIAGDLWFDNKPFERKDQPEAWIEVVAAQFKHVVLILGNHDYWQGSLQRAPETAKEAIAKLGLTNVHLLERDEVVIDDVKFAGATLWTSFANGNPLVLLNAANTMNDYDFITYGRDTQRRKSRPNDMYLDYIKSLAWLKTVKRDTPEQKLVIMTHMPPSYESIAPHYRIKNLEMQNYLYYSDLDYTVMEIGSDFWFHGHTHTTFDYMIESTRVLCNPRGYFGESTGYGKLMLIDTATKEVKRDELTT